MLRIALEYRCRAIVQRRERLRLKIHVQAREVVRVARSLRVELEQALRIYLGILDDKPRAQHVCAARCESAQDRAHTE